MLVLRECGAVGARSTRTGRENIGLFDARGQTTLEALVSCSAQKCIRYLPCFPITIFALKQYLLSIRVGSCSLRFLRDFLAMHSVLIPA